jgi:hypothetical protein
MDDDHRTRRVALPVTGIVIGALFLALGAAALFLEGGWIVAVIALAGGALTAAAGIFTLVRS